ncbi:Crp/Fnr family transcriptional regulator [Hymenobacter sp. BT730]|uniref:Crp/Fnr family transcriptional regulator n=1 Tax=Hymenobacter sp. BT730 TaxID=3063332 RepID=UPI0026E03AF4|nr:cyclic nucleotide-binding domain-containing protein [Hymenobacter sp. BT730]
MLLPWLPIPRTETQRLFCAAGHCLFRAGRPARGVYWLERGSVGIWSRNPTGLFQVISAPAWLGTEHLVASRSRYTVQALQPCVLVLLSRSRLERIAREYPPLRFWLLRGFSQETMHVLPHYE